MQHDAHEKIVDLSRVDSLRSELSARGESIVHCHGCFDIVHPGHIHHLRFAASQGDRLVVSITPDRFVNKGPDRPLFNEILRADNLAALSFVDWVVINDAPTSVGLLERLRPDVYIKGAEYSKNSDPRFEHERAIVEEHGGRVVFSDDEVVFSSSALVDVVREEQLSSSSESGLLALARGFDLSTHGLTKVLRKARKKRVFVLSESIIDLYAHCQVPEIAQEHPMLSLSPDHEVSYDGGGAIIAKHLLEMGLDVTLCTPVGSDLATQAFVERMQASGVNIQPIDCEQSLPIKLRYLVDGKKVMKIDSPVRYSLPDWCADEVVSHVHQADGYDAMVIADFGLGLFANGLASRVIEGVRQSVELILGDVSGRRAQLSDMRGADVLCPCEVELRQMLHSDERPVVELANEALEITQAQSMCVTRAGDGLLLFDKGFGIRDLPALCFNPTDVLGCGDALLAGMTASLVGGADRIQAAYIGSLAAAVEGGMLGNLPVSTHQILERATQLGAMLAGEQAARSAAVVEPRLRDISSVKA